MLAYKLTFKSALHVDSRGSGEPESVDEFIRSDTLSAALCLAWTTVFPDEDEAFFFSPPFRVSSAFPFMHETFLFPAPLWPFWEGVSHEERKRAKKVKWICPLLTGKLLNGGLLEWHQVEVLSGGNIAVSREHKGRHEKQCGAAPWVVAERQRVSVDRLGMAKDGGLFFFALQFFAPDCGLYFMADVEQGYEEKFEAALSFLGDTGIGADRNSGLGHFEFSRAEDFFWPQSTSSEKGGWYLVSLFNPGPDDDLKSLTRCSAYGLSTRSGWMTGTTLGRPPIRVFTEGSYFSADPVGHILPMFDDRRRSQIEITHPAARDFRAFAFPCARPISLSGE